MTPIPSGLAYPYRLYPRWLAYLAVIITLLATIWAVNVVTVHGDMLPFLLGLAAGNAWAFLIREALNRIDP